MGEVSQSKAWARFVLAPWLLVIGLPGPAFGLPPVRKTPGGAFVTGFGGAYSVQLKGHVRMDLLYGAMPERRRHKWDVVTSVFLIAYIVALLYGAQSSLSYALEYGERSYSSWRPYMWPVKVVMLTGIFLMLLQAISQLFKDLAAARGKPLA